MTESSSQHAAVGVLGQGYLHWSRTIRDRFSQGPDVLLTDADPARAGRERNPVEAEVSDMVGASPELVELAAELEGCGAHHNVEFYVTGLTPGEIVSSEHCGIWLRGGIYEVWYSDMGQEQSYLTTRHFVAARRLLVWAVYSSFFQSTERPWRWPDDFSAMERSDAWVGLDLWILGWFEEMVASGAVEGVDFVVPPHGGGIASDVAIRVRKEGLDAVVERVAGSECVELARGFRQDRWRSVATAAVRGLVLSRGRIWDDPLQGVTELG